MTRETGILSRASRGRIRTVVGSGVPRPHRNARSVVLAVCLVAAACSTSSEADPEVTPSTDDPPTAPTQPAASPSTDDIAGLSRLEQARARLKHLIFIVQE